MRTCHQEKNFVVKKLLKILGFKPRQQGRFVYDTYIDISRIYLLLLKRWLTVPPLSPNSIQPRFVKQVNKAVLFILERENV